MFQSGLDFLNRNNSKLTFIKIPKEQLSEDYIRIFENGKEKKLKKIDGSKVIGNLAPFILNPIQTAFFNYYRGENTLISTPTGTGKTIAFYYALLYKGVKKTIYISPTRALANQIYKELKEKTSFKIVLKTGEYKNPVPEDYDVIVCTAESFVVACRNYNKWLEKAELIVFDEIHMLFYESRSLAYEEALIWCLHLNKRLLLLSATLPNIDELIGWLNISLVILSEWRPIPLERRFYEINYPSIVSIKRDKNIKNKIKKFVGNLLEEILLNNFENNYKTILVVPSKELGWLFLEEFENRGFRALNNTVPFIRKEEGKVRVAFHNADIPKEERERIEGLFKDKNSDLTLVIATQTLALGFNSPADDVIIMVEYFSKNLTPSLLDLLQFEGRAGRVGFTKKGKGTVHYIVRNKQHEEKLRKELETWNNKKFFTLLEKSYKILIKVIKKETIDKNLLENVPKKLLEIDDEKYLDIKEKGEILKIGKVYQFLDNISLVLFGLMTKNWRLIENSLIFWKIKNKFFYLRKIEKDLFVINNCIKTSLEKVNLIKGGKLTLEGKLISFYYLFPLDYLIFLVSLKYYKKKWVEEKKYELYGDFLLLWNTLPMLLRGNYAIPSFYPDYWAYELIKKERFEDFFDKENYEYMEIMENNKDTGLLLYGSGYFAEFIYLEVKENKGKIMFSVSKVRPPAWISNLKNEIDMIIEFLKRMLDYKLLDLNIGEEELKRLKLSFTKGIDPNFSLLGELDNIGYNRAYLLKILAKEIGVKNEKELIKNLKKIKENPHLIEITMENIYGRYLNKLKKIVKLKYGVEYIDVKIKRKLKTLVNKEKKELIKTLSLLEKEFIQFFQ